MSDARLDHVTWCESEITRLEKENAELRAKLEEIEKQLWLAKASNVLKNGDGYANQNYGDTGRADTS